MFSKYTPFFNTRGIYAPTYQDIGLRFNQTNIMTKLTEELKRDLINEFQENLDIQMSKLAKTQSTSFEIRTKIYCNDEDNKIDEITIKIKKIKI